MQHGALQRHSEGTSAASSAETSAKTEPTRRCCKKRVRRSSLKPGMIVVGSASTAALSACKLRIFVVIVNLEA